jgi:hypothetical protein
VHAADDDLVAVARRTAIGVPQPTVSFRGVRHSWRPVAASNAATNDPPGAR